MLETKKSNIHTSHITINGGENIHITQINIFQSHLSEHDTKVLSVEEVENKAKNLEILASVSSIIATLAPIIVPLFSSLLFG